jgi:hypothetical protein
MLLYTHICSLHFTPVTRPICRLFSESYVGLIHIYRVIDKKSFIYGSARNLKTSIGNRSKHDHKSPRHIADLLEK